MGRPAKPVQLQSGAMTKADRQRREEAEKKISPDATAVQLPTMELTERQRKIRKRIVKEMRSVLKNADRFIVDQAAIAIDRLQTLEQKINEDEDIVYTKNFISVKKEYFSEFVRLCNELSLSPQARAKLANAQAEQQENPLKGLIGGEDDDDEDGEE
ncbi:MAG: P27 family phage terminase small subunit [Clostridia bacterium]|nr:P27 family phage terminase small subunit [Clostridia bacterium]